MAQPRRAIKSEDLKAHQIEACYRLYQYSQAFSKPLGYITFRNHHLVRTSRTNENRMRDRMRKMFQSHTQSENT